MKMCERKWLLYLEQNHETMRMMDAMRNNDAAEIPSPPPGERVRARGQRRESPQYGKHRARTAAARNFARQLRRKSTDAEKCLWRLLRDRRFNEFKFRRQYACGIYFLDFYCTIAKLAVELDGGGHGFPDQRARDEQRNQFLVEQGIKVLHFWNHQLRGELETVRFEIWHALMERMGRKEEIAGYLLKPAPHPSPSHEPESHETPPRPSLSPGGGEGENDRRHTRNQETARRRLQTPLPGGMERILIRSAKRVCSKFTNL
jgi:very-short-patch-repair endonuclease